MHDQKSSKNKKNSLVCKEILAKHCIELPDDGSLVVEMEQF
jgi:hypothetical protein